jgi:hypothetical protein
VLPVLVELKLGVTTVSQKQYFIPHKAQVKIQKQTLKIWDPLTLSVILEHPLITRQKPGTENFRPVQDLGQ